MSLFITNISLCDPIKFLAILYPKSLVNLVIEVGNKHSHQILLWQQTLLEPVLIPQTTHWGRNKVADILYTTYS